MTALQGYFDALQYNHTGTQFFNINKKLAMRSLMDVRNKRQFTDDSILSHAADGS